MASSDLTVLMVSEVAEVANGSSGCNYDEVPSSVPPEPQEGNIEYKLKLVSPSADRLTHLATQMLWRLREGQGEAIYEIGVEDSGSLVGLVHSDLESSLDTLKRMAEQHGAVTEERQRYAVELEDPAAEPRYVAEVLVHVKPDCDQVLPLRVAVLGGEAAGKSTLLGVLTRGELDNGRGSARVNLLQHRHEVASGNTSSICHELLGFDETGEVINYGAKTTDYFVEHSAKLVSFVDLAGHKKYQRTTKLGLSCWRPEFIMLIVSASIGVEPMTREHLGWTTALHVPLFVVVTKTDRCSPTAYQSIIKQLSRLVTKLGSSHTAMPVRNQAESELAARSMSTGLVVPIISVSSVTGENLDLLKHFLNLLPASRSAEEQLEVEKQCPEFQVECTYGVSGHEVIVGGYLTQGVVRLGDELVLGPDQHGSFHRGPVMSLRRNRFLPCRMIRAGQMASISLACIERSIARRGSVLLGLGAKLEAVCWEFEASVCLLFDPQAIQIHRQVTVLMGAIRQGAAVMDIHEEPMKLGVYGTVRFRFLRKPEYVSKCCQVIVECGRCKGIGSVLAVFPVPHLNGAPAAKVTPRRRIMTV